MSAETRAELLRLSQQLLASISSGDWKAYAQLCSDDLTAFEPEALGHLVEGLPFHQYYFELPRVDSPRKNTITSPHVRLMGSDAAVVCYVRLVQYLDGQGVPQTAQVEETRVWERRNGQWKHVHFHRSVPKLG